MEYYLSGIIDEIHELKNGIIQAFKSIKDFNSFKRQIPNLLTVFRFLFTIPIIHLIITNRLYIAGLHAILAIITDLFDGYLARKWNCESELGRKLDALIDKLFIFLVSIPLAFTYPILFFIIFFEITIALINGVAHLKKMNPKTIAIGKVKTFFLDTLVIITFFVDIFTFDMLFIIVFTITLILEFISLFNYFSIYYTKIKEHF